MSERPKILYVDDEQELLELAASFFEEEALPIETCATFDGALLKLRTGSYDLIISDSHMPAGSGQELISIIKSEKLDCKRSIIVTGNLDFSPTDDQAQCDLVLFKPIKFQELIAQARGILKLEF